MVALIDMGGHKRGLYDRIIKFYHLILKEKIKPGSLH
jgi:hypothetical protein